MVLAKVLPLLAALLLFARTTAVVMEPVCNAQEQTWQFVLTDVPPLLLVPSTSQFSALINLVLLSWVTALHQCNVLLLLLFVVLTAVAALTFWVARLDLSARLPLLCSVPTASVGLLWTLVLQLNYVHHPHPTGVLVASVLLQPRCAQLLWLALLTLVVNQPLNVLTALADLIALPRTLTSRLVLHIWLVLQPVLVSLVPHPSQTVLNPSHAQWGTCAALIPVAEVRFLCVLLHHLPPVTQLQKFLVLMEHGQLHGICAQHRQLVQTVLNTNAGTAHVVLLPLTVRLPLVALPIQVPLKISTSALTDRVLRNRGLVLVLVPLARSVLLSSAFLMDLAKLTFHIAPTLTPLVVALRVSQVASALERFALTVLA
jgi:hypothetical protein